MSPQSYASTARTAVVRRTVLRMAGIFAASVLTARPGHAVAATKETGLSYEGLLKGVPGFQPRVPAPMPEEIPGFVSKAQMTQTYSAYRDAFAKLLNAEKALSTASRAAAQAEDYGALRTQQISSANAVLLHEFYFRNLASRSVTPSRYVRGMMSEHMGTFDDWREDFTACARVAEAWAVLVYDPYDDRWHNLPLSAANAGGMAGNNPLVVCDVSAHAWSVDYKDKESYVSVFLDHLNWDEVGARYRAVDRK